MRWSAITECESSTCKYNDKEDNELEYKDNKIQWKW